MARKTYNTRQMKAEGSEFEFFFPKANPPRTIKAKSREEAEAKLEEALPEEDNDIE